VRAFHILSAFLIALAMIPMLASSSQASTQVWVTIGLPSSQANTGSTFTTDLNISSWNGAVGALDLTIRYNPSVLHILDFSTPSDSPFYSNSVIDSDSYTSGETHIAGFQTRDSEAWETPITLGVLTWKVVGEPGSTTDITIEVRSIVDVDWKPVEVLAYGQQISVLDEQIPFNVWVIIGPVLGVLVVGGIVYYFFRRRKGTPEAA